MDLNFALLVLPTLKSLQTTMRPASCKLNPSRDPTPYNVYIYRMSILLYIAYIIYIYTYIYIYIHLESHMARFLEGTRVWMVFYRMVILFLAGGRIWPYATRTFSTTC